MNCWFSSGNCHFPVVPFPETLRKSFWSDYLHLLHI
uniref:Uncharacterized protein n=1 Tax=Anguilla anguilla TaxID=7936 RepID=A0A0E9RXA6_ANGAN